MLKCYDREAAVNYALKWALGKNPDYYHFGGIGGDCTNFISQCVFAGAPTMNFEPLGWFYQNPSSRSPSWTSVEFFHKFILHNIGFGPFGTLVNVPELELGDIVQLRQAGRFNHSLIVTKIEGGVPYICAHSTNVLNKPLSSYLWKEIRCIKILGYRT